MAKVHEAEQIAGRTPLEAYLIDRTRGIAASGLGDTQTAIKSFEAVLDVRPLAAGGTIEAHRGDREAVLQGPRLPKCGVVDPAVSQGRRHGSGDADATRALALSRRAVRSGRDRASRDDRGRRKVRRNARARPAAAPRQRLRQDERRRRLRVRAREGARLLPEEGILGRCDRPRSGQARIPRASAARRAAVAGGDRRPRRCRAVLGDGAARARHRRAGRGETRHRQGLRRGRPGQRARTPTRNASFATPRRSRWPTTRKCSRRTRRMRPPRRTGTRS